MNKITVLLLFVLLAMVPWFFFGGPDYYSLRSVKFLWNFGHIVFFATAVFWSLRVFNVLANRSLGFQCLVVVLVTTVAGVLIEWLQYGLGRQVDIYDLIRNITGGLLALLWFPAAAHVANRRWLYFGRGIVTTLVLSQLFILSMILIDEWRVKNNQPRLSQFDSVYELSRWDRYDFSEALVEDPVKHGDYAFKVALTTDKYSGVALKYFYRDWRAYDVLQVSIFNPDDSDLSLVIRVHDKAHSLGIQQYPDRFNRRILLTPGWNQIEIDIKDIQSAPDRREINLAEIQAIGLFSVALKNPRTVFIDSLRLVKVAP